jgi:hypothetical protein
MATEKRHSVVFLFATIVVLAPHMSSVSGQSSTPKQPPVGCIQTPGRGFDSFVGILTCGETRIHYDIGLMAGDNCRVSESVAVVAGGGAHTIKVCSLDYGHGDSLVVSLPDLRANYYVERPTARDVVLLLRVAQEAAER